MPLVLSLTVDPSGETRPVYPSVHLRRGRVGRDRLRVAARRQRRRGAPLRRAHQGGRRHGAHAGGPDCGSARPARRAWPHRLRRGQALRLRAAALGAGVARRRRHGEAPRAPSAARWFSWAVSSGSRTGSRRRSTWSHGTREAVNAPGVVLHAQVLRNLLNGGLIAPVPGWVVPALALLAAGGFWVAGNFAVSGAARVRGRRGADGRIDLAARARHVPADRRRSCSRCSWPSAPACCTRRSLQLRERRRLRRAFGAYVSPRHHARHPAQRPAPRPRWRALLAVRAVRRHPRLHRAQRADRRRKRRSACSTGTSRRSPRASTAPEARSTSSSATA